MPMGLSLNKINAIAKSKSNNLVDGKLLQNLLPCSADKTAKQQQKINSLLAEDT